MNADLPENPSAYTSMSGVAQAFSQTLSDTRELSGPLAGLPVPADLTPITCTWLASMSRSDERSTVAPAAGWNVTAEVIAGRFAIEPAEYVPPASSTT